MGRGGAGGAGGGSQTRLCVVEKRVTLHREVFLVVFFFNCKSLSCLVSFWFSVPQLFQNLDFFCGLSDKLNILSLVLCL